MAKKKSSKKSNRSRKQAAAATKALPAGDPIPEGFKQIGGGYADTWKPENIGDSITGTITGAVKEVELTQGRKKVMRRCCELTEDVTEKRHTIWESAVLSGFMDTVADDGVGTVWYLLDDGLGVAKRGQNAPKLYTVAQAEA